MYKLSLIVSSFVFLLVLGYIAFTYKPSREFAQHVTQSVPAQAIKSTAGEDLINRFESLFAHPVDPRD